MEIDFTTLILELVNFLILMLLLKHFLYKPILNVVGQRQANIDQQLQAAQTARNEAVKIQADYQDRLAQIDRERQQAMHLLEEEMNTKRAKTLQDIRDAATREEEKSLRARENKELQWRREVEQQALLLSTRFAANLLRRVTDADLHHRLVQLALEEFQSLDDSQRQQLVNQGNAIISTAITLNNDEQQQLRDCLQKNLKIKGDVAFKENKDLIAGIRLAVGAWTLGFNLADELSGFANCIHEPMNG